jgi:hypothetical protein
MAGGASPRLVHRPELVTRGDGRYEVRCNDCRGRSDERVPIGIGLPESSKVLALEMLRNHGGQLRGGLRHRYCPNHLVLSRSARALCHLLVLPSVART